MQILLYVLVFVISYLLGSVNSSIIIYRLFTKKDIRDFGSGNAGMTNTMRALGKRVAALVFIGDALKAVIAIIIGRLIIPNDELVSYIAGFGAITGHNFPIYFGFRGGKGISTSIAVILMTNWAAGLTVAAVAITIMFASGIVSLGSVIGCALLPFSPILFARGNYMQIGAYAIYGALALYMHRANIGRLINGTENSFRKKK